MGKKLCAAVLVIIFQFSLSAQDALTNDSIVKLVKAEMSEDIILTMVKTQPTKFEVGVDAVLTLKTNGVSEKIISAMVLRGQNINPAIRSATPANSVANVPNLAQASGSVKEPEYIGVFFYLNPTDGKLIPLERQNTQMRTGAGGFWSVSATTTAEVDGEKSPVRFKQGENLDFIVKLGSQQNDPQGQIGFATFDSEDGKRLVVLAKATARLTGSVSSGETWQSKLVAYDVAKYGESSFRVSPKSQLLPGEYVLGIKDVAISFCFGIDGEKDTVVHSQPTEASPTSKSSTPAVVQLCTALKSSEPDEVVGALKKLRDLDAPEAVPKILPCLTAEDAHVVRDACRTLAVLANKDVIPNIEPLLTDKRSAVRKDAQNAIEILKKK